MTNYVNHYELKQVNSKNEEFELVIYLDDFTTEFSNELTGKPETKDNLMESAKKLVATHYPDVKVTLVRVMVSGMIFASFPIAGLASVQTPTSKENESLLVGDTVRYRVQPGDTLWKISQKYNTTVNDIKKANRLESDILPLNQSLIIPKAIHTVAAGEYLSTLAKRYNVTIDALKLINNLSEDKIFVGQVLIIPQILQNTSTSETAVVPKVEKETANSIIPVDEVNSEVSTYRVVAGDSLSVIAKRFGTTIDELMSANKLTSTKIQTGQQLIIPNKMNAKQTEKAFSYTVKAGDTLYLLAQKFQTSIHTIMEENGLVTSSLSIGQVLQISETPSSEERVEDSPSIIEIPETYVVKSGDTLFSIANRFNISKNFLMINNQIVNEMIQPGQVLRLKENFIKGDRNQIGTVTLRKAVDVFLKDESGNLVKVNTLAAGGSFRAYSIDYEQNLYNVGGNNWVRNSSDIQFLKVGEKPQNTITYITHKIASGDTIWGISVKYGIPQSEMLKLNGLTLNSPLRVGQMVKIPQYQIAVKQTASTRHGEHLDWWTEAQYVIPIGKTFKVTDFATGKSFVVKRTIGANHADCETVSIKDTNLAKEIWKGFSWTERAVIIEVDGRKVAASMSFMPHDVEYIKENGITGHFDIHFKNSTRHKDGKIDEQHQKQVNIAAGLFAK
jgi:peptidoglycan DL-endopeptidase LytF